MDLKKKRHSFSKKYKSMGTFITKLYTQGNRVEKKKNIRVILNSSVKGYVTHVELSSCRHTYKLCTPRCGRNYSWWITFSCKTFDALLDERKWLWLNTRQNKIKKDLCYHISFSTILYFDRRQAQKSETFALMGSI